MAPSPNRHLQVAVAELLERVDELSQRVDDNDRDHAKRIRALEVKLAERPEAPTAVAPVRPIGVARPLKFVKWAKNCRTCGTIVQAGAADPPVWYDPADKSLTCPTCPHPATKAA